MKVHYVLVVQIILLSSHESDNFSDKLKIWGGGGVIQVCNFALKNTKLLFDIPVKTTSLTNKAIIKYKWAIIKIRTKYNNYKITDKYNRKKLQIK